MVSSIHWRFLPLVFFTAYMLVSCDWQYNAMSNSVPIEGKDSVEKRTIRVYLGIDGASHSTIQKAMDRGAFSATQWRLSKMISPFPSTSDLGWSRIMRTSKVPSYEFQYYNAEKDRMYNTGQIGVLKHADPFYVSPAQKVFNYLGNGHSEKYWVYQQRPMSFATKLDGVFIKLQGVSQTSDSFAGFFNEIDTSAHMGSEEDIIGMLIQLSERIASYKASHQDKNFIFTLFSDHGNDFVNVPVDNMVEYDKELEKLNIINVSSLGKYNPEDAHYAIPIVHTRVTYVAFYTHRENEEAIARKLSTLESADVVISHSVKPDDFVNDTTYSWYSIWKDNERILHFGFDRDKDQYVLGFNDNYQLLDLNISFDTSEAYQTFSDDELFAMTKHSEYPDVFFRTRTALADVGIEHPANVILSCKPSYASIGFKIPGGANEIASSSFHGSINAGGSNGILLSEEKDLPDAVRLDTFLDVFPKMKTFITENRRLKMIAGDQDAGLDYTIGTTPSTQ